MRHRNTQVLSMPQFPHNWH